MSSTSLVRATALFTALAWATCGRAQDPIPLPLPIPPRPGNGIEATPPKPPEVKDDRVSVLDKGPIHEGFAQPSASVRGKGLTAPKAPPVPVEELLPEAKPEGEGIKWLPGYWQWDSERADFIWVCGLYRNAPPDRTWESGHWKEVNSRWTYFPGFWRPTNAKTMTANLPEPPASTEDAPTGPNANPKAMWVPGVWEHKNGKYQWQAGYWPPAHENLIWVQGQYVATEHGYVFVSAHWDYPIEERGVLFTPVYFSATQRAKIGWSYRPQLALAFGSHSKWGDGGAFDALYIGPNFNHYYYGDYSAWRASARLASALPLCLFLGTADPLPALGETGGFQPWDHTERGYTNPLWQHYIRLNRTDIEPEKPAEPEPTQLPGRIVRLRPTVIEPSSGFTLNQPVYAPGGTTIGIGVTNTVVKSNKVVNTYNFIQPAAQVVGRQSIRPVTTDGGLTQQYLTKNTTAYQRVTRHGNLKTGYAQSWTVTPPVQQPFVTPSYNYGYRR